MYPQLLADLDKAEKFIFLEFFILRSGKMWDGVEQILRRKAAQGVDVRLIYDDFGSLLGLPSDFVIRMEKAHIRCIPFNPVVPLVSLVMNHRDHRKIVVIDGKVAYTGGINLADEYINAITRFGYWKDAGLRIEGAAVWNFTVMFLDFWNAFRPFEQDYSAFRPQLAVLPASDGVVQPYADSPLDEEALAETVYLNIINQAQRYVYIYTPYFAVGETMLEALKAALVEMGSNSAEAVEAALEALCTADAEAAQKIVKGDSRINNMERDIEHRCMTLLLRQQPVASDLRFISAAMKVVTDVERIGDHAADIAEIVPHLAGVRKAGDPAVSRSIEMGRKAHKMLQDAMSAFAAEDEAAAKAVIDADDAVDYDFNTIKRMLQQGMDAPRCKVGIMGITFKENCPDIRNSKVIDMVREFQSWGAQVVVTDPWANAQEVLHEYGLTLGTVDASNPVDSLVVAVGHNEYRQATPAELRTYCRGPSPVLADVKSLYNRHQVTAAGFTVFRL